MPSTDRLHPGRETPANWLLRFLLGYGLWVIVSQFRLDFLLFGILAAAVAASVSMRAWPRRGARLSLLSLPGYLLHFLRGSVVGGLDVAGRAFHPRMPLAPYFLPYHFSSTNRTLQVVLADVVTLMPGTLVVRLDEQRALFHILSDTMGQAELEAEERHLQPVFPVEAQDE
ncbi:MAG TPA: Na+/H+ antiporter subunit E [Kiloniellales bacterium]|nr:Na+/H+ antiporter subunit E [Kiloniellales bacterium]